MFNINFQSINAMLTNISSEYHVNAELYEYSDMHNTMSTTKVFKNYIKLYVNEKIALEIKFDKNDFRFREFMCDAKRSRAVAEKLVETFDELEFRYTKKQTFITCENMSESLFTAILYNAVLFALMYDNNANTALYKKACELRK